MRLDFLLFIIKNACYGFMKIGFEHGNQIDKGSKWGRQTLRGS